MQGAPTGSKSTMTSAMFGPNAMSMAMGASSTSPGQSSPESFEIEEDSNAAQSAQWPGTEQTSPTSGSQPPRVPAPLQKRRRVTRACDECRRKKIKCDGKQPCTHCTVYSYGMIISAWRPFSALRAWTSSTNVYQTARTTNLRTDAGTLHHNTSKLSKTDCNEPRPYLGQSFRMWT